MEQTIKILISYHKPDYLFLDSVLTPIHAGRAKALQCTSENDDKLRWMLEKMIGDDTGDNISEKNGIFNEMTTVYWAWKNYDRLDNPDYIGFMHYRRHFLFDDKMEEAVYEIQNIGDGYFDRIKYDVQKMRSVLKDCDFACVKPQWRRSLYEHFKTNHEIEDLDTVIDILKEKYPKFAGAADQYLSGQDAYFCNMFIFPKEIFFEYAAWFFDITFELINRIDFTYKRLFVSEWLTGIYITYLLQKGKKGKFFPTMIAEGEHRIPIVMASDNGYAYPLAVAAASLMKNAAEHTIYDFYFLISEDFSEDNQRIIKELCEKFPKNSYQFVDMGNAYETAEISIEHITKTTYYRLKLPSLLPKIGKCIYLDVDIVVKGDLSSLYRICIDDKYIAGVRALGYFESDEKIADKLLELGIPSMEQYINAGVLLMNLEKMRRDHLEEKFDILLEKKFGSQDQDILNVACYGKIRLLPFQFNVMTKYPLYSDEAYDNTTYFHQWIKKDEWNQGRKKPIIIHYADRKKPWSDMSCYYADEWWEMLNCFSSEITVRILNYYKRQLVQNAYETERLRKLMAAQRNDLRWITEHSKAYKTGNIILYVPKKICRVMRCMKDHGFGYTMKLIIRKIVVKV